MSLVNCCNAPAPALVRMIATRSPGWICSFMYFVSVFFTDAVLTKDSARSSTTKAIVRRTWSGRKETNGIGPLMVSCHAWLGGGGFGVRARRSRGYVGDVGDFLPAAILSDLKLFGAQIGYLSAALVCHRSVNLNQICSDANHFGVLRLALFRTWFWLLAQGRSQQANQYENERLIPSYDLPSFNSLLCE